MDFLPSLKFNYARRFGIELEINAFNGLSSPVIMGELPDGIEYIGNIVAKTTQEYVEIRNWQHTHWSKSNGFWVIKPDASCGIEVCSPVVKGWNGLMDVCKVVDVVAKDNRIKADSRCSLHVHVDVSDLPFDVLDKVLKYWIKCEQVFLDAMPESRKCNRYCQAISLWDWLYCEQDAKIDLVYMLGRQKYLTLNTFHLAVGTRHTIEFRIGSNEGCKDPLFVKNWVRLMLHFTEMAKMLPTPGLYQADNPWSSFIWLDPKDVFKLLGFDGSYSLSPGMKQVKNWFLERLNSKISKRIERSIAAKEVSEMMDWLEENVNAEDVVFDNIYSS